MAETGAIPVVVLSRQQDPVEVINSTLRNAGHPVHCTWVRDLSSLGDALAQSGPQLIFLCSSDPEETLAALEARQRYATQVPTLLVRDTLTEDDLAEALKLGAQDVVTLRSRPRLQAVAGRELHAARLDHALAGTLASARQYRDQMKAFMTGSTDAIAHVEEGIVVDVNPAWVELFGHEEAAAFLGQPLMDFFQQRSHAALKGALVATAQGRWANHSLQAVALMPAGTELPVQIEFERFEFEGEPAVRMRVPTQTRDLETLTRQLDEALQFDTTTGLMKRAAFVEQATTHAAQPLKAGLRALVYVEPDRLATVENELGPLAAEDLLEGIGQQLRAQLQPGDLAARVTARGFALLVERGNTRDLDAWVARVLQRVSEHVFSSGDRALSFTCSAGATLLNAHGEGLAAALQSSVKAARNAAAAGGNRLRRPEAVGRETGGRGGRPGLGVPHQVGAHGEPLPARAPADRQPGRRGRADVRPRGAHARRAQRGGAAVGIPRGGTAHRPDEEHRPVGRGRRDVVLRRAQQRARVRAPVHRLDARPDARRLAAAADQGVRGGPAASGLRTARGDRRPAPRGDPGAAGAGQAARVPVRTRELRFGSRSGRGCSDTWRRAT